MQNEIFYFSLLVNFYIVIIFSSSTLFLIGIFLRKNNKNEKINKKKLMFLIPSIIIYMPSRIFFPILYYNMLADALEISISIFLIISLIVELKRRCSAGIMIYGGLSFGLSIFFSFFPFIKLAVIGLSMNTG